MEQCKAHGDLMESIGVVKGTVQAIREDQMKMREDIGRIFDRIEENNKAHTRALVEAEKEQAQEVNKVKAATTTFFLKLIALVAVLSSAISSAVATYLKQP